MKCQKCGQETPEKKIGMMTSKGIWCVTCVGGGVDKLFDTRPGKLWFDARRGQR